MGRSKLPANTYRYIDKSTIELELTQDQTCLIDAYDYDLVKEYRWFYNKPKNSNSGYVLTNIRIDGKQKILKMHRLLMSFPDKSLDIDHINRNGCDNRRCNLRICTHQENQMNTSKQKNNKSNYKGVYFHKRDKKYISSIRFNKKLIHLGYFEDPIEAAKAYDKKAKELFKEFAVLNFPKVSEDSA